MAIWPSYDYDDRPPWQRPRRQYPAMLANIMPGPEQQRPTRMEDGRFPYGRPSEGFGADGLDYPGFGRRPMLPPRQIQPEPPTDWTTKEWFPRLFELMQGRLAGGRRGMMNQMTGGLGRSLGRHLSRTNVPVPVGANALARRYMSPMTQAMEQQDPFDEISQAMALAKMFAPGFGAAWGEKSGLFQRARDPMRYLEKYMDRFGGGL
jgi:hypothetical protein